jgi:hypothetical protein
MARGAGQTLAIAMYGRFQPATVVVSSVLVKDLVVKDLEGVGAAGSSRSSCWNDAQLSSEVPTGMLQRGVTCARIEMGDSASLSLNEGEPVRCSVICTCSLIGNLLGLLKIFHVLIERRSSSRDR